MNPEVTEHRPVSHLRQSNILYFRKIFTLVGGNWYWFAICFAVALICAVAYLKYTYPTYRVNALILIEEGDTPNLAGADQLLQGFGLQPGVQNLDNQILILSSWTLIKNTLEGLPFYFDCYKKGVTKHVSFYPSPPLKVVTYSDEHDLFNREFTVRHVSGKMVRLSHKDKLFTRLDTVVSLGEKIETRYGAFSMLPTQAFRTVMAENKKVHFVFQDMDYMVQNYQKRLKVETASNEGTIVNLSLEGTNSERDRVFLDELTRVFLASNLEKKNHEATRVIEFIEEQLVSVSDSLMITENKLQEFRSRNRVMNISLQGQQIIEQAVRLEEEKANLQLKENYYEYLRDYLSKEEILETPVAPTSMGLEDPLLTTLMQDLAELQAEYFSGTVGDKNPLQSQLELRIKNTKQSLNETLEGIIHANELAMEENQSQIRSLNSQAAGLPRTERQLLGIEREFNLNNVLYTFLLQRRAEAQIQKASNKPDNDLVDPARAELRPVAPNEIYVIILMLMFGLGFPFVALILIESFNTRILSEEDLKMISNLPVAGHIPHSRLNYQAIVLNDPQSDVAEAFRSLRMRMEFFTKETHNPVIAISSSIPGEGKTFSAVNLASAYSLTGKKTVIVGFDLRRPKLSPDFQVSNNKGVSTYLIGKDSIEEIISPSGYDNLDIIPAGPVPPNPAELTASQKTRDLFTQLKEMYDFIVVDTAPVGVVSDGYSLASYADANILMVRHRVSLKRLLEVTLLEAKGHGIGSLSLLVNDLKSGKGSYKYAYSNKYGYTEDRG